MKIFEFATKEGVFGAIPLYVHNEQITLAVQAKLNHLTLMTYQVLSISEASVNTLRELEKLNLQEALCVISSLTQEQKNRYVEYQLKNWECLWQQTIHQTISGFKPTAEQILVLEYLYEGNFLEFEGHHVTFIGNDDECSEYNFKSRLDQKRFIIEWLLALRDVKRTHRKKRGFYVSQLLDKLLYSGCYYGKYQ